MGVAEIVGFAVCWLVVSGLMLWGVFTEHKRGATAMDHLAAQLHPSRMGRSFPGEWVLVDSCPGSSPEVAEQARLIAAALLASRGIDLDSLPPSDIRTEVTSDGEGNSTTRFLVRAGAMHASRRRN